MKQFIAVIALISVLGSSLGVHVMHHDIDCCGRQAEIIELSDLIQQRELSCCMVEETPSCHSCDHEAESCTLAAEGKAACCKHEVVLLQDGFPVKQNQSETDFDFLPVLIMLDSFDPFTSGENNNSVTLAIRPPPARAVAPSDPILTCVFLC